MELKYFLRKYSKNFFRLLIELYGIEIRSQLCYLFYVVRLLIELYGIEMLDIRQSENVWVLLIELYGIEILAKSTFMIELRNSFNRTIWNWNNKLLFGLFLTFALLIELYGIEISLLFFLFLLHKPFNRTIWNWNAGQGRARQGRRGF